MISLSFVLIASFFNACMDSFENENYYESIFKSWDIKFWYKRESWKYAKKIFGYHVDGWHLAKSLMIICVALAMYTEQFSNQIWHTNILLLNIGIDITIMGIIWNLGFNLFYHHIFRIK
jgi:hypothetical protein